MVPMMPDTVDPAKSARGVAATLGDARLTKTASRISAPNSFGRCFHREEPTCQ